MYVANFYELEFNAIKLRVDRNILCELLFSFPFVSQFFNWPLKSVAFFCAVLLSRTSTKFLRKIKMKKKYGIWILVESRKPYVRAVWMNEKRKRRCMDDRVEVLRLCPNESLLTSYRMLFTAITLLLMLGIANTNTHTLWPLESDQKHPIVIDM